MASEQTLRMLTTMQRLGQTETIVYVPAAAGAVERTIQAPVDRLGADDLMHSAAEVLRVSVVNDAAKGVSAAELNKRSDKLRVAERVGGTPADRLIRRIVSQDAEWLTFELQ